MLDQMTHLFRLSKIVEAGSMRKASNDLNVTQPALSRSIAKLEERFGKNILIRHSRGIEPTEFGKRLLSSVNRLSRHWELSEEDLMKSGEELKGRLKILAGPFWRSIVLPSVLGKLHKKFPSLIFEMQRSVQGSSIDEIVEGRCDIMFGGVQAEDKLDKRLVQQKFTSFYDRIIARKEHPIFNQLKDSGTIAVNSVLKYPWILYTEEPAYEMATIHGIIEKIGRVPDIRIESESLIAVINLLQSNDYLCILPEAAVRNLYGPQLTPLPIDLGRRNIISGAIYREEMTDWPPLKELLKICGKYFNQNKSNKKII